MQRLKRARLQNNRLEIENDVNAAQASLDKEVIQLQQKAVAALGEQFSLSPEQVEAAVSSLPQIRSAVESLAEQDVEGGRVRRQREDSAGEAS